MVFTPGQPPGPGRAKGGLNKVTKEIREMARALIEDPEYRADLIARLQSGKAPHMEVLLFHYAYGKPKDVVEILGDVTITKIERVIVDERPRRVIVHELKRIGEGDAEVSNEDD